MNRWSGGFLRVIFAFVIVFLAGIVSISVSAIFHSQRNVVTGITFLAAVVCLSWIIHDFTGKKRKGALKD
jgi:ABC-type transport system involved in cytochrome bd biosynthesis fused ATPase/permease subunit